MMDKSSDYFIVNICSPDHRSNCLSKDFMYNVALYLTYKGAKKYLWWNYSFGYGMNWVRSTLIKNLHDKFPSEKYVWSFWLDSDIEIDIDEDYKRVGDMIIKAEKTGMSFAGEYKTAMKDNNGNISGVSFKTETVRYDDEDLLASNDFDLKLNHSGLGLCYLKTPTDYKFNAVGFEGEDFNFFRDNKELIDLRYCRIDNDHYKNIALHNTVI